MKFKSFSLKERHDLNKSFRVYSIICKSAVAICFILICVLSLLPANNMPHTSNFPFGDKGAHAIAYAGFGMCTFLSISFSLLTKHLPNLEIREVRENLIATFHVFLIGLPLGIVIEIIQSKVGRNFDLYDWLADAIGLTVGCIIAAIINHLAVTYRIKKVKMISV